MKEQTSAKDIFRERSPNVVALDNLIRRKLRVSDPSDPVEIAGALKNLYQSEKEALEREAAGVPYIQVVSPPVVPVAATSSQAEIDQAVADVERDLKSLTTNSLLKDIEPELNGWASAIRAAAADGINAARMALDPRQRDLAFANRRTLGDYARVVRYVGALTPNMNMHYRRLAQSLDEVAAVMLVLMGETLANIGFGGGRFLLQVTASELQERRDAVILSLRNLTGSMRETYGGDQWPRGIVAYRQFLERLETSGQTDLRALFVENNLARLMDDLIHRTAGGGSKGMRETGVTYQLAVESLRRLIIFGQRLVDPEAPPLAAFLSAVQLFLDAFTNSASGYRMLYIARPPIIYYGLYGIGGPDPASEVLLQLVLLRGQLAEILDCYLGCNCDPERVGCQLLLDKILYDVDRAIDLYARGIDPEGKGEPENRAAAYGFIVDQVTLTYCFSKDAKTKLQLLLDNIKTKLWHQNYIIKTEEWDTYKWISPVEVEVYDQQRDIEFVSRISGNKIDNWIDIGKQIIEKIENVFSTFDPDRDEYEISVKKPPTPLPIPPEDFEVISKNFGELPDLRKMILQELCIQKTAEESWEKLLRTMAPSCIRFNGLLDPTKNVIDSAIKVVGKKEAKCPKYDPNIPPTLETSVAGFSYVRNSEGD